MIPQGRFNRFVHLLLIMIGAMLFIQTIAS